MIWPNHVSAWLVNITGATGKVEGVMILAGVALCPAALPDKRLTT